MRSVFSRVKINTVWLRHGTQSCISQSRISQSSQYGYKVHFMVLCLLGENAWTYICKDRYVRQYLFE